MTLRKLKALAHKLGATIVDDKIGDTHECTAEAPHGKVWSCDGGLHMLVACAYRPWKPDYEDLHERMEYGLEDCPDPECEWCHPDE